MATTSERDLEVFVSRQLTLLSIESDAEIERTSLLISSCSHKLLEKRGLALGGLGVASIAIGLGGKSLIELERPSAYHTTQVFPPHTLRTGDLARIAEYIPTGSNSKKSGSKSITSTKESGKAIDGVVYKVSDTKIVLAVDSSSSSSEELDIPDSCTLVKLANTVTHDRMRKAIEQLQRLVLPHKSLSAGSEPRQSNAGPNALHRVLLGMSAPSSSPSATHNTSKLFFDSSLNPSQIKAVDFALGAPEVACIHGPPGTGKTRVLVEIIRQLVYAPNESNDQDGSEEAEAPHKTALKILVCGASNLAVDNLLERLSLPAPIPALIKATNKEPNDLNNDPGIDVKQYLPIALTRLGHPARVMSSLHSRTLDAQAQMSEEAALVRDVKDELEEILGALSGKGSKGSLNTNKASARGSKPGAKGDTTNRAGNKKGQRLRGEARREAWKNVKDLRKEYRKREEGVLRSVLSKAQVILATCHGAGSRQLQNVEFDVVVIDEATQALEAVCWIPVLKAKKLILAGDPMQLGPTIISEGNRRHSKGKREIKVVGKTEVGQGKGRERVGKADHTPIADREGEDEEYSHEDTSDSTSSEKTDSIPKPESTPTKAEKTPTRSLLRPPKTLQTTMFDRLETMYGNKIKKVLDLQYRMNRKICSFPSKTLYHSRLTSHTSNASRLLRDLPGISQDEEHEDIVGVGSEVVFWDTAGAEFWERSENDRDGPQNRNLGDDGGSLCNENEAEVVKRWVAKLMAAGLKASQIAIITPYQAQSQLLSALLPIPELEIGTADGMQGRENEAIVLSLVRSNPEGEVGFLKEKRRLNVAMTRAKRHLCVVGDSSTIRRGGGSYLKKWMNWLENEADVRFAGDA